MFQNWVFRQGGARNFYQTWSAPKQFNSNELGDAGGKKFSGKPTKYEAQFWNIIGIGGM